MDDKLGEIKERADLGELCRCCGKRYLTIYRIPDEAWERITGIRGGSVLLCPACCDALMREAGLHPYWEATLGDFPLAAADERVRELVDALEKILSYDAGDYGECVARKKARAILGKHGKE